MDVGKWVNLDFIFGLYIWSMEILHISDDGYPALLKKIYDPPSRLFCYGDTNLLKKRNISIVGTRKITEYGRRIIDTFLTDFLTTMDIVVVSGLAYGVDTYVHTVCLERGIATIAVIAGGINTGVPKGNTSLLESICKSGIPLSFNLATVLPRRNAYRVNCGTPTSLLAHLAFIVYSQDYRGI